MNICFLCSLLVSLSLSLSLICCALSLTLCPSLYSLALLLRSLVLSLLTILSYLCSHLSIWFYAAEFKTKGYVQILATPRRDRAAAKDPAGIQKSQAEWSTKKKKKNHHPFPLLGHKFHFLCSQPCATTPPHPHLTAFNLLPFLSCRTFFFLKAVMGFLYPGKWGLDSGLGGRNRQRTRGLSLFYFLLIYLFCCHWFFFVVVQASHILKGVLGLARVWKSVVSGTCAHGYLIFESSTLWSIS